MFRVYKCIQRGCGLTGSYEGKVVYYYVCNVHGRVELGQSVIFVKNEL